MSETIGSRIRKLREALGWSQQQLARKIPISQKQISRIEQEQVMAIPRPTLIRIGEVLQEPVVSGELNRWLYREGYRPYVRPRLPLSPSAARLLALAAPHPAVVLDVGWFVSAVNPTWEQLTGSGPPDQWPFGHLLAEVLHPAGRLNGLVTEDDAVRLVARLIFEWTVFPDDEWVAEIQAVLYSWLGTLWRDVWRVAERSLNAGSAIVRDEVHWLFGANPPSLFRCRPLGVPDRPDLRVICYLPSTTPMPPIVRAHPPTRPPRTGKPTGGSVS